MSLVCFLIKSSKNVSWLPKSLSNTGKKEEKGKEKKKREEMLLLRR